jgi:adenine specific DNA methylase Mod
VLLLLLEEQNGFGMGRSCLDNIFTIKHITEKLLEFNFETHLAFVDLEKAFDRLNLILLWLILRKYGYPEHLVRVAESSYKDTRAVIEVNEKSFEKLL